MTTRYSHALGRSHDHIKQAIRMNETNYATYLRIARSLREFGYPGVNRNMIAEVHEAMKAGRPLPHGVVGMFAKSQLEEAFGAGEAAR